jgi:predicted ATPase
MEFNVPRMVGRDRELCQLKDFLHNAVEGNGNVILISGEAGIGKTRLINELEAYAEPLGIRVLEGCCLYESPTPFLPFRDALRNVFQVSKSDTLPLQERKIRNVVKASAPDFVKAIPVVGQIIAGATVAYRAYRDEKGREKRVEWGTLFERDEGHCQRCSPIHGYRRPNEECHSHKLACKANIKC